MPPLLGQCCGYLWRLPDCGEKGAGQGRTGRGRAMEGWMDGWTDGRSTCQWGLAGTQRCWSPPALYSTSRGGGGGGLWGKLPLQREEAGSLLPTPRKSGFDISQPPKPSAPGGRARGQAAQKPLTRGGGWGSGQGPPQPSSLLPPPPPRCLPCPCRLAGHEHPAAPTAAPAPSQQRSGGGHGGVTSSPNRRFPPALGTMSGASQPSPGLLLLPWQTPNKHGLGEAPSILAASPGETEAPPHTGAPPATRSRRGARGSPTRVSPVSGSSFVLFLVLSLPAGASPGRAERLFGY